MNHWADLIPAEDWPAFIGKGRYMKLNDLEQALHNTLVKLCKGTVSINMDRVYEGAVYIYRENPVNLAAELRVGIEEQLLGDLVSPEDDLRDD